MKENKVLEFYYKRNELQYENYINKGNHDLNLLDKEYYDYLSKLDFNNFDDYSKKKILKDLVEKSEEISTLKNKLDSRESYGKVDSKKELSLKMKSDVLTLMELRNSKVKAFGFNDYMDFIFSIEGINKEKLIASINKYIRNNKRKVSELSKKYALTQSNYFTKLVNIKECNSNKLKDNLKKFEIDLPKDMDYDKGFPISLEVGNKLVKLNVNSPTNIYSLSIVAHELGHYLAYTLNERTGQNRIMTDLENESKAVLFERFYVKEFFNDEEKILFEEIKILENYRCCISFLFELSLYDKTNINNNYKNVYKDLYQGDIDCDLWSLDSFRSIDPVYIQNYYIGDINAVNLLKDKTDIKKILSSSWWNKDLEIKVNY